MTPRHTKYQALVKHRAIRLPHREREAVCTAQSNFKSCLGVYQHGTQYELAELVDWPQLSTIGLTGEPALKLRELFCTDLNLRRLWLEHTSFD